jgi:hypothetical protein
VYRSCFILLHQIILTGCLLWRGTMFIDEAPYHITRVVSQHFRPPRRYVFSNTLNIFCFHNTLKETSQNHVTTDVQLVCLGVCYILMVSVMSLWGALSDEGSVLSFATQSLQYLIVCQYMHKLKQISWSYNRRSVGQSLLPSGSPLEPLTIFVFSVWQLWVSWYRAASLTRGWVCNLLVHLLLGFARAANLGSKSRRTNDYILLFHMRLLQPGGPSP